MHLSYLLRWVHLLSLCAMADHDARVQELRIVQVCHEISITMKAPDVTHLLQSLQQKERLGNPSCLRKIESELFGMQSPGAEPEFPVRPWQPLKWINMKLDSWKLKEYLLLTQSHSVTRVNHKHDSLAFLKVMLPQVAISPSSWHVECSELDSLIWAQSINKIAPGSIEDPRTYSGTSPHWTPQ